MMPVYAVTIPIFNSLIVFAVIQSTNAVFLSFKLFNWFKTRLTFVKVQE